MDNGYLTHSSSTGMSQGLKYWESLMSMGACLVGSQWRFWMATKLILQTTAEITEYQTMLDLNCEIQFECCRCLYFKYIIFVYWYCKSYYDYVTMLHLQTHEQSLLNNPLHFKSYYRNRQVLLPNKYSGNVLLHNIVPWTLRLIWK